MNKSFAKKFEQWLCQIDRDAKLTPFEKMKIFDHFKDEAGVYLLKWMLILEKQSQNQLPSGMSKLLESGDAENIVEDVIKMG